MRPVMLRIVMLRIVMLRIAMLRIIMLRIAMLRIAMLRIAMLRIIMLRIVAVFLAVFLIALALVRNTDRARRDDGRNRMLVDHLVDAVAQHYSELIEGFDLPLQFDPVHQENRRWNSFSAQDVQERIL